MDIEGTWDGAIDVAGQHIEIRVSFTVGAQTTGRIDIPVQQVFGLELANITVDQPKVSFELSAGPVTAKFAGSVDDESIGGEFEQGGMKGTFRLTSAIGGGKAAAVQAAEQQAKKKAEAAAAEAAESGYNESGLTLSTPTGTVYGTLTIPERERPPVALIIAGSGPTDRNGNSPLLPGPNNSLLLLAHRLADRGIATLRFDKRGIAQSAGAMRSEEELTFDDYVNDAAAWLSKLLADDRFGGVGVIGHSEGSLIAMLAASKVDVGAYVSIAGIGEPADDLLRKQLANLPDNSRQEVDRILKELKQGRTVSGVDSSLQALFRPSVQPYIISWLRYDPSKAISALKIPTQIVQGTADLQVMITEAQALKAAKPDAKLVIIEEMNHVLKTVGTDTARNQAAYSDPSLPVSPELVDAVAGFLLDTLK